MASDIEIVNDALDKLGDRTILSFADESQAGRLAARTYARHRDSLLRESPWNFAIKRASLAADAATPEWGFLFQYPHPADLLRVVAVNNTEVDKWRNEGGMILTDLEAPLEILYVARVLEGKFDPTFVQALSSRLAVEWAMKLTQTRGTLEDMQILHRRELRMAKIVDGQSDNIRIFVSNDFINARFRGASGTRF